MESKAITPEITGHTTRYDIHTIPSGPQKKYKMIMEIINDNTPTNSIESSDTFSFIENSI